jgi:hypothetical protein
LCVSILRAALTLGTAEAADEKAAEAVDDQRR